MNKPDWHLTIFNDEMIGRWEEELWQADWDETGILMETMYKHGRFPIS